MNRTHRKITSALCGLSAFMLLSCDPGTSGTGTFGSDTSSLDALTQRVKDLEDRLAALQGQGAGPAGAVANGMMPQDASFNITGSGTIGQDLQVQGAIIRTGPAGTVSVNGIYCGESADLTTGEVQYKGQAGYRGLKLMCEDACKSPHAHMCAGDELARSVQIGALDQMPSADHWYTSFSSSGSTDCYGWENNGMTISGPVVSKGAPFAPNVFPATAWCSSWYHVACCK